MSKAIIKKIGTIRASITLPLRALLKDWQFEMYGQIRITDENYLFTETVLGWKIPELIEISRLGYVSAMFGNAFRHGNWTMESLKDSNKDKQICQRCGKANQILAQITYYCPPCEYELSGEMTPQEKLAKKEKEKQDRELTPIGLDRDEITKKVDFAADPDGTIYRYTSKP